MEEEPSNHDPKIGAAEHLAELLGISLHAIFGASSSKTMRLVGKVNHQTVIVLIDTGRPIVLWI